MKIILFIIIVLGAGVILIDNIFSAAQYDKSDRRIEKIVRSSQYLNGKFHNKVRYKSPSFGEGVSMLWKFIRNDQQTKPGGPIPSTEVTLSYFQKNRQDGLYTAWLGHSSVLINIEGYRILTDPVLERKISILGPSRFKGELPLQIDQIPDLDMILITHNHYDHLNRYSIEKLHDRCPRFLVPLGVGAQLEKWGVPREKITEMDWWESVQVDDNLTVTMTPSQHFSGRGLSDKDVTLWGSYVVKTVKHSVFFSGDSGYFDGFKEIGERYGPFDITFLECGAYNERWQPVHMFPEETVQAHLDLKGKILHPIHWGTFNLSLHAWNDPMIRILKEAEQQKVILATPIAGELLIYGRIIPTQRWWENNQR